ncbi:hypothetical protein [Gracilibacillus kekensis]|uniref:Uncharacterized protein n=1 Tax=Gracilibacillus kekensis TaxID=1027249 RepID=A0A1M7PJL3_9BACI|nr:hypothetical protein [Gracilibacillus kekensis]SHN17288.1 hypothetical protein SAMN05216179_2264 [Gracilibacillus kekensis]
MRNMNWLSIIGSVGIGIAAYNMMNGQGKQMQESISNLTNMGNQK